ncbi:MAG TPA: relaxase domain-containing protein, partial [Microlunatus sp.]|nr:relaxase domain-containing protein [Microlunatus sp.]
MTVHVLHAGNGYTYLTRSVAACDARLGRSESLADYYVAKGQPPGRWAGRGSVTLNVSGVVTEAQMKNLFGEGRHPNADTVVAG